MNKNDVFAPGLESAEELYNARVTRILTVDFPRFFAVLTCLRSETGTLGPAGGVLNSTVVPQVEVVVPEGACRKKIRLGLQVCPVLSLSMFSLF